MNKQMIINSCVNFSATLLLSVMGLNIVSAEQAPTQEVWSGYDVPKLEIVGDNLADTDGDGVIDARDDCENVNADAAINNAGCAKDKDIIAQTVLDIQFKTDAWHVDKKYYPELKRFSVFYKKHPAGYVSIEGHTDNTGNAKHNMKLSQLRAQAVVKVLTDNYGFDKHKINWIGYGETRPVADNKTWSGRKKNRRIVAVIRAHELQEVRSWSIY